ncbi:hypothetical protein [Herbaspirillum robiniae]|uniref:hypothetical protein n=1 Tax=Herbaspirillum robiniae TaxID=2014887 RepID=UPI00101AEA5E|nr:hypothetical protein [Herbaspirillum robiniae]
MKIVDLLPCGMLRMPTWGRTRYDAQHLSDLQEMAGSSKSAPNTSRIEGVEFLRKTRSKKLAQAANAG